jgi:hypothetical protein
MPLVRGPRLDVYALHADDRCEVWEFIERLDAEEPKRRQTLVAVLHMIGELGFRTPESYFRRIHAWQDQWEVRSGRHRLYGFQTGASLVLCCHGLKQGQKPDSRVLARVDRLRREWTSHYETPR